jgi:hypothetical protein
MGVINISKLFLLNKNREMKPIILILLIPIMFLIASFCYLERNKKNITISNGEKVNIYEILNKQYSGYYTERIYDFDNFTNSAILNALAKDENDIQNLTSYLGWKIDNLGLGYFNYLDKGDLSTYNGGWQLNFNYPQSTKFYQTIFNNKSAREFLFYESLYMLKKLCKNSPQDFHNDIQKEVDDLLVFVKQLKSNPNIKLSKYPPYLKGFILRRIKTNKVPISEIEGYLNTVKKELLMIKEQLPIEKSYCELNVNNEIEIIIGRKTTILKSKFSNNKFKLNIYEDLKELYYFEDNKNSFYKIICDRTIKNDNIFIMEEPKTYIFDNKLNLISE